MKWSTPRPQPELSARHSGTDKTTLHTTLHTHLNAGAHFLRGCIFPAHTSCESPAGPGVAGVHAEQAPLLRAQRKRLLQPHPPHPALSFHHADCPCCTGGHSGHGLCARPCPRCVPKCTAPARATAQTPIMASCHRNTPRPPPQLAGWMAYATGYAPNKGGCVQHSVVATPHLSAAPLHLAHSQEAHFHGGLMGGARRPRPWRRLFQPLVWH